MRTSNYTTIESLKAFGLKDDDILEIAIKERLRDSIDYLKEKVYDKWHLDTLTVMKIITKIKEELNS